MLFRSHAKHFQEAKSKESERVQLSSDIALIEDVLPMYQSLDEIDAKVHAHTEAIQLKSSFATTLHMQKVTLDSKIGALQTENEGLLDSETTITETSRLLDRAKHTLEQLIWLNLKNDKLNAAKMELEVAMQSFQTFNQRYLIYHCQELFKP